ncbi:MAG TPA: hypothetical protein PKH37_02150 [Alphaproteobacteria bacterium]|nr:hypothetical protein [Alphaproteobacteria bacterium]
MSGHFVLRSLFGSGASPTAGGRESRPHSNVALCGQLAQNVADMLGKSSMGDVPGTGVDQTVALMQRYDAQCGGFRR